MTQVARFALLAVVMLVTPCGSSSQATAISSPASTPSAAESVAPPLNVIATAEDYTGKPPPVGAIVMTMSDLTFHPSTPAGTGSKVVIYIDNQDPRKPDCGAVGGAGSTCNQHALLVLGPGDRCWARLGSAPATSEDVLASLQRLHQVCSDALEVASQSGNLIQLALASRELRAALEVLGPAN